MIKLIQTLSEQQVKLLQMAIAKQIVKSTQEFRDFGLNGSPNLATAAREDVEFLESFNIKLNDLINSDRI